MQYDGAGNLSRDTHTGDGTRIYDGENRMTGAQYFSGQVQTAGYTYDADGRRVRRSDYGAEVWQIYGMDGELTAEYAAQSPPATPQKEYGYRGGELLVSAGTNAPAPTPTPTPATPTAAATFLGEDAATQGNWKAAYATNGFTLAGDAASIPDYAQVTVSGHSTHTWAAATSDPRAPQQAASESQRVAATWYSFSSLSVDINFTDGRAHKVALYCLDWDANNRAQTVEVLDAVDGTVLATRPLAAFTGGKYQVWQLAGHVTLRLTNTAGAQTNAVLSAVLFDPAGANVALAAAGASATGSSQYSASFPAAAAINGDRYHEFVGGNYNNWHSAAGALKPDWLEIEFAGSKTMDEISIVTQQDAYASPVFPTATQSFTLYGLQEFTVQYWDDAAAGWVTVAGGAVSGNARVWRRVTFGAVRTNRIRVLIAQTADGYSRVQEVEAYEAVNTAVPPPPPSVAAAAGAAACSG